MTILTFAKYLISLTPFLYASGIHSNILSFLFSLCEIYALECGALSSTKWESHPNVYQNIMAFLSFHITYVDIPCNFTTPLLEKSKCRHYILFLEKLIPFLRRIVVTLRNVLALMQTSMCCFHRDFQI